MKKYIIGISALLMLGAVTPASATSDGDDQTRPRPGSEAQAEYFVTERGSIVIGGSGDIKAPHGTLPYTTDFGRKGDVSVLAFGAYVPLDEQPSVEPLSFDSVERP